MYEVIYEYYGKTPKEYKSSTFEVSIELDEVDALKAARIKAKQYKETFIDSDWSMEFVSMTIKN